MARESVRLRRPHRDHAARVGRVRSVHERHERPVSCEPLLGGPPVRPSAPGGPRDWRSGGRMRAAELAPVRRTNVRRSMVTMLICLAGLSTPLAAQETRGGMVTLGLAYTVGSGWQIQGFDVGYGRGMRSGPIAALSLSARLGEFIDQRAIVGGSQGFVFGATLAARSRALTIAEFGADTAPSRVGLDVTVETTGYAGAHSPLGIGSPWGAVSVLPGLRVGQFGIVLGPTAFFGTSTIVRAFLGLRFDVPLARRERHP